MQRSTKIGTLQTCLGWTRRKRNPNAFPTSPDEQTPDMPDPPDMVNPHHFCIIVFHVNCTRSHTFQVVNKTNNEVTFSCPPSKTVFF